MLPEHPHFRCVSGPRHCPPQRQGPSPRFGWGRPLIYGKCRLRLFLQTQLTFWISEMAVHRRCISAAGKTTGRFARSALVQRYFFFWRSTLRFRHGSWWFASALSGGGAGQNNEDTVLAVVDPRCFAKEATKFRRFVCWSGRPSGLEEHPPLWSPGTSNCRVQVRKVIRSHKHPSKPAWFTWSGLAPSAAGGVCGSSLAGACFRKARQA